MIQLDYRDSLPIYEQVKERFKELILKGALNENDKVPSVRELSASLTINPNTIVKAYKELENEGYIYSVKAKGYFVAPKSSVINHSDTSEVLSDFKKMLSEMKFLGIEYDDIIFAVNKIYKKGEDK